MAEVFLAKAAGPMGFEKKVVVKRILPHLADDPRFIEMFLSEARIVAQLDHPNVVQVFDFGREDGAFFLAMEFIDGLDVRTLVERAKAQEEWLPFGLCARIVSLAAQGLAYAHDFCHPQTGEPVNLVHRDATPENVLLSRNGSVKVVDFGVAKVADSPQTKAAGIKGKLPYMAPEQIRGESVDRRTDVYALGVMLYQLLTGERPYDADSEAALMQHITYRPHVPAARYRELPDALNAIVDRALAKSKEDRFSSCHELREALEQFILESGEPASAHHLAFLAQRYADATGQVEGPLQTPLPMPRTRSRSDQRATRAERGRAFEGAKEPVRARVEETRVSPSLLSALPPKRLGPEAPSVVPPRKPKGKVRSKSRGGWVLAMAVGLCVAGGTAGWIRYNARKAPMPMPVPIASRTKAPARPKPVSQVSSSPTGTLVVAVDPPMDVAVNGVALGRAPVTLKDQPAGDVTIEVWDETLGLRRKETRALVPGNNGTVRISFAKARVEFRVRPYGEVFLDGRALGMTPLAPVEVYEGEHRVEIQNKELGRKVTKTYVVNADESLLIKVDLTEP
jgi:serine/threonine protein kinase